MTKLAVLGCGSVGRGFVAAADAGPQDLELELYDADPRRLSECARLSERVAGCRVADLSDPEILKEVVRRADLVVDALPGRLGFRAVKVCGEVGRDVVSVSFMPEDPLRLGKLYEERGCTLIPDAGFAPGLSNLFVGRALAELGRADEVRVYCGGLPERPVPPLGYVVTWSPEDLLEEYTRPARIIAEGRVISVDPLSSIEEVEVPGCGVFEAFYTDGLRTMLSTLRGRVVNAAEMTLRYKGHLEKIKLLRDLGLLSDRPVTVEGVSVVPRRLLARLLDLTLRRPEVQDVALLYVVARRRESSVRYLLRALPDPSKGLSAMARVTGLAAYAFTKLLLEGMVPEGVVPPEMLGESEEGYREVVNLVGKGGVEVREFREA